MTNTATQPSSNESSASRRWRRPHFSIQSKLLVMLLTVSLLSAGIVGVIGYFSGRDSLRAAAFEQLTSIRDMRAEAIQREIHGLQRGVRLDSRNDSAVEAARAFVSAFNELNQRPVDPAQLAAVREYYENEFVPALESRSGLDYEPEAFVPVNPAGVYLQSHYVAGRAYDDYDTGLALDDAGDGSAWSAANARYGSYFTGLIEELGYEDVLVLDKEANVVYTAYKSVELGVNMRAEPYSATAITKAFDEVMRNGSLDEVVTTDFERYLPSLNVPTAWVVSPVGSATEVLGALAIQVPIDQINEVMTGDYRWQEQGLGKTGEVYLGGSDLLMRSISRLLVEEPERYAETVIKNGTQAVLAERIVEVNGTVQLQPIDFPGARAALAGETGTIVAPEYTSPDSLVAYAPAEIDGLDWVIVAHMDSAEAFAPVTEFTRNLVLSTLALLLGVSLASLLLAQVFARPVRRLVDAVRKIAGGDLSVQVPEGARDEFGDLGNAFNDMASGLRVKQELIDAQRDENQKLLLTLMPESVAERYKRGEETIAEEHDNVSVVYAELVGFDDFASDLSGTQEITQLNSLMRAFDEAAQKAGVEKVRALRAGYLAASGLIVPRVDHVRRAVEFAKEMRQVVQRFNAQHGTSLDLRAGVDSGTVTSGLVARTTLAYDLWGDAVSLAYRVRSVTDEAGVYVSQTVRDRLHDSAEFVEAGVVEVQGVSHTVWRLA